MAKNRLVGRKAGYLSAALLALILLPSCDKSEDNTTIIQQGVTPDPYDFYVDARRGNDLNPGSSGLPFKTIARALAVVFLGETIKVAPGTYDSANGETFPMVIPAGVTLLGDEANKGAGAVPTFIEGSGTVETVRHAALHPGASVLIAGFTITNNVTTDTPMGIYLNANDITIRDNTITNTIGASPGSAAAYGIGLLGATGLLISGNVITDNGVGINEESSTNSANIQGNILSNGSSNLNIQTDASTFDLGGGILGSPGGNQISCGGDTDIGIFANNYILFAKNNLWDHLDPVLGMDILFIGTPGSADFSGAGLVPSPCP